MSEDKTIMSIIVAVALTAVIVLVIIQMPETSSMNISSPRQVAGKATATLDHQAFATKIKEDQTKAKDRLNEIRALIISSTGQRRMEGTGLPSRQGTGNCLDPNQILPPDRILDLDSSMMTYYDDENQPAIRICQGTYTITQTNINTGNVNIFCEPGTTFISTSSHTGTGINFANVNNVKIKGCGIQHYQYGIFGISSNQVTIRQNNLASIDFAIIVTGMDLRILNNEITTVYSDGIMLFPLDEARSIVENNNINCNGLDFVIWGITATGGIVTGNTISNCGWGLNLQSVNDGINGVSPLIAENNQIQESNWYGIFLNFGGGSGENVQVKGNYIASSRTALGLIVAIDDYYPYSSQAKYTINENTVISTSNPPLGSIGVSGLKERDYAQSQIKDNTISGADYGLILTFVDGITASANIMTSGNQNAINCYDSDAVSWYCNQCNGRPILNQGCEPPAMCQDCGGSSPLFAKQNVIGYGASPLYVKN